MSTSCTCLLPSSFSLFSQHAKAMNISLFFFLQILAVPTLSPLVIGIIRKIKALLQNRVGADIFQPYRDLWKLFHKDEVLSVEASWVTRFFPLMIFVITAVIGASVPLVTAISPLLGLGDLGALSLAPVSDFIVIVYLFAAAAFLLALLGMDQGSSFGGFGSSREMMVSALAEGGFFFALLAVSIVSQTGSVMDMVSVGMGVLPLPVLLPLATAFIGFFMVLLAENARFPFDNPSTHLELTMIHEAMVLELSGKRLALAEWAAANKLLIFIALGANLFFPWGIAESTEFGVLAVALIVFLGKVLAFATAIALIESLMAKFRLFRLPDVLFTAFILSVIAIGISIGAYV